MLVWLLFVYLFGCLFVFSVPFFILFFGGRVVVTVVWFGLVWFGLVWFGLAWFGLVCLFVCLCVCVCCFSFSGGGSSK